MYEGEWRPGLPPPFICIEWLHLRMPLPIVAGEAFFHISPPPPPLAWKRNPPKKGGRGAKGIPPFEKKGTEAIDSSSFSPFVQGGGNRK